MAKICPNYKEDARSRIIRTSASIFAKKGFRETTIDDIAREIGVSRGAIYRYYKSKTEILQELFLLNSNLLRKVLERYLNQLDALEVSMDIFNDLGRNRKLVFPLYFEMMSLASCDEEIRTLLRTDYEHNLEAIQGFIDEQVKKGIIRSDIRSRALSEVLIAMYLKAAEKDILGIDPSQISNEWKEGITTLLRAI